MPESTQAATAPCTEHPSLQQGGKTQSVEEVNVGNQHVYKDGRVYFAYKQVHELVCGKPSEPSAHSLAGVARPRPSDNPETAQTNPSAPPDCPDVIVAIGGGGFIPARMLRSTMRGVPILAVGLELYEEKQETSSSGSSDGDGTPTTAATKVTKIVHPEVETKQWFAYDSVLGKFTQGGKVVLIDEVDDSRRTLQYCLRELVLCGPARAAAEVAVANRGNQKVSSDCFPIAPSDVLVCVVHNKLKEKHRGGNLWAGQDENENHVEQFSVCSKDSTVHVHGEVMVESVTRAGEHEHGGWPSAIRVSTTIQVEDTSNTGPAEAIEYKYTTTVRYCAGCNVPGGQWNCYPWDATAYGLDIEEHESRAAGKA